MEVIQSGFHVNTRCRMNRQEKEFLKKLVTLTNIIKYTIGLPLLVINSVRFIIRVGAQFILLYFYITLRPNKIKVTLDYIKQLSKGLGLLWAPNQLRS